MPDNDESGHVSSMSCLPVEDGELQSIHGSSSPGGSSISSSRSPGAVFPSTPTTAATPTTHAACAESSASPTSSETSSLKGTPIKTSKSGVNKTSCRLNVPRNIPLSRISSTSSSSATSSDPVTDEGSEDAAEDPRSLKTSYATLGDLVFSRCNYRNTDSSKSSHCHNHKDFKDRADELRDKIKQRKSNKDRSNSRGSKVSSVSSSVGGRNPDTRLNDELINDLDISNSDGESQSKRDKFKDPRLRKPKRRVNFAASTNDKIVKKKSMKKDSKLAKLDLLEEYAQMLRDAIKDESDDNSEDSEKSTPRNKKSSKQFSKATAKKNDDITEVIKIEPLSSDEMDVADSPSPVREAPPESPVGKKETLIPKIKEEDIVYIKTEPSDDYDALACATASCSATIPMISSNITSNNVMTATSSSFSLVHPNFSTNAVSAKLPQTTPSHLTPPTLPPLVPPLPLPPVPFSARPRLSFCPPPNFDSAMNPAQPRPPPPPPPPIPFPAMETICNPFNIRNAATPPEPFNPTVPPPTRPPSSFGNLSNLSLPPFSQSIASIGGNSNPPNPLPVLSQIAAGGSIVPPFPPTMSHQNGSVPAPTFPATLPLPGPPPLSLPNINSLPNIPLPPPPLSNPITSGSPLQLNLKPVAQVNSTIVLDPNNPSAPLTFNTKLTSYIPESSVQVTPTFSNANFSSTHSTCQSKSTINSSLSNTDSKFSCASISNMKSENITRTKAVDVAPNSINRTGLQDQCSNRLSKKRARSPSPLKVSIDFSRNISFESFLGTGLALSHRPSSGTSQTARQPNWMYDNVNQFDFVAFKSEVNQHSWMPLKSSSKLQRVEPRPSPLVVSTPALGYYLPSDCGLSLLNCGTTDRLKDLQRAFQVFMRSLSREELCQMSEEQARELNSVMNSLSNIVLRLGSDASGSDRKNSGNNKKTAEAMLKQLRITVTGNSSNNGQNSAEDEIWKSNIETLLSTENDKTKSATEELPGEVYHSKTARSKKKRLRNVRNGDSLKRTMKSKIDSYLEQSNIDDDLVHEKLKLEYVSLQKADQCRLHPDIYPNEPNYHCDKPACTCLGDNKTTGPHHNVFYNEPKFEQCDVETNNLSVLYHYYINMKPNHHFFLTEPSKIEYDGNVYLFNGFSIFSHECLDDIPAASYTKGQTRYTLELIREKPPTSFCVKDCDLLTDFIFENLLEFLDFTLLDTRSSDAGEAPGCRKFHLLPRFERHLPEAGIEVLSAHEVLRHIISSFAPLFDPAKTADTRFLDTTLESRVATSLKDHLVYYPGKKPLCVRVDNLNFRKGEAPKITHTSLLPSSLSFLGDKKYLNLKKLHSKIRETMHFRNDPNDQEWLMELERMMNEHKKTKRATVLCELPGENCYFSGLKCDITHCAVFLPRVVFQLRRHLALRRFCHKLNYTIRNPLHFEVAFTHSTAPENVLDGTNKSHVRASRYRVGKNMNDVPINERSGDMKLKAAKHKRNLFTMIQTMRKLPMNDDQIVDYPTTENYERIEFLGDAVLELIVTTHLFFMLPEAKEGILSLFRIPLVANTHLSKVSKRVGLHRHLVISHDAYFNLPGPREKIHADILEAFLGAVFLDSGLDEADRLFAMMFFPNPAERKLWTNLKPHEFQVEYPQGDRHLIEKCATLKRLTDLENLLGIKFKHISLLGRALSSSSLAYNFLSRTNNERMEYLGDTVMKFLVTNFIYRHFPVYHENHLSTLRGSLVSRFIQEEVARDLRLSEFTLEKLCVDLTQQQSSSLTTKRKADLFEAFLAAVFVDQGLETCQRIFKICIFPKIPKLLKFQRWLTPHLMLHCCFLAIRSVADFEKSLVLIPSYRILSSTGPNDSNNSNTPDKSKDGSETPVGSNRSKNNSSGSLKRVGVFVGGKMFGVGTGKSLNQAAIQACREALAFFQSKHPNTLATMLNSRVDSIVNNLETGICDYSSNSSSEYNKTPSQKSANTEQSMKNSQSQSPRNSDRNSQRGVTMNSNVSDTGNFNDGSSNSKIAMTSFGDGGSSDRSVNDRKFSGMNNNCSGASNSSSGQYSMSMTSESASTGSTKSSGGAASIDSQSEFSSNTRNFYQIFSAY